MNTSPAVLCVISLDKTSHVSPNLKEQKFASKMSQYVHFFIKNKKYLCTRFSHISATFFMYVFIFKEVLMVKYSSYSLKSVSSL